MTNDKASLDRGGPAAPHVVPEGADLRKRDAERYQEMLDDPESARHFLWLLLNEKGTQDDLRRMQDRIHDSKRTALLAATDEGER